MAPYCPIVHATSRYLLLLCCGILAACSSSVPDSSQFGSADGVGGTDVGFQADITAAGTDSAVAADAGPVDAGPADVAVAGATCYAALNCLLEKKQWRPGKAPPKDGTCMAGMEDEETMQSDALVGCVQTACKAQFDAWDSGGAA